MMAAVSRESASEIDTLATFRKLTRMFGAIAGCRHKTRTNV